MNKMLMYDKYDETYREVIDVKELKEYILKRIEEIENTGYVYFKREKHSIYYEYPKIIFHNKLKKLTIQNDYLSMQELQAINKKVQELRMGGE